MDPNPSSSDRHDEKHLRGEKEADRLTRMRTAVLTATCKQMEEPHGLLMLNLEAFRTDTNEMGVTASMTLHGCPDCLVHAIAGSLGKRLSLSDLSRTILMLADELEARMRAAGHVQGEITPGLVH